MADNIEHQDKGELVANCDQLQNDEVVVTTPVESRIMSIRGKQIMIDRDLAELYGVETKRLNEAVKRNIERFPERFRFQLTKEEMAELVANCDRFNSLKHSTVRSYAFTEQGVAMLSTVLRSETAIRVSIRIMDAFVAMRRFMVTNAEVFQRLSTMEYHQLEMQQQSLRASDNDLCQSSIVQHCVSSEVEETSMRNDCQVLVWHCPGLGASAPSRRKVPKEGVQYSVFSFFRDSYPFCGYKL